MNQRIPFRFFFSFLLPFFPPLHYTRQCCLSGNFNFKNVAKKECLTIMKIKPDRWKEVETRAYSESRKEKKGKGKGRTKRKEILTGRRKPSYPHT
ncbi:hypothetical protein BDQ94DRAFT_155149 [Aspergillus welwitschiae]|uniref:Secreted protein n=1 Tax=Aspergillus welwitschiae TaxID=1341132 RepID=A0A3F3PIA1_9EURO|nr:hypothetical protein BDQ94DRAFT_155149 [Aspergillus welwitschiae]RDH26674.1 hypothetical protein BDQ94DRAFT_155149 [Aspergillus welwitschiae]